MTGGVVEHNSGNHPTSRCRDCNDERYTLDGLAAHARDEHGRDCEVQTGIRYAKSALSGQYYRVTAWVEYGDGKIQSRRKERVDPDAVPDEWKEALDERPTANAGEHQ